MLTELVTTILPYQEQLFVVNLVLTIVDAAVGYHVAPLLLSRQAADDDGSPLSVAEVRRLLAVMGGLYMFGNCLARYGERPLLLLLVLVAVVLDIVVQLLIRGRLKRHQVSGEP